MKKCSIAILLFFSSSLQVVAAKDVIEKTFSQLTWVNANANHDDGSRFGYDAKKFTPTLRVCTQKMTCYDKYEPNTFLGTYRNEKVTANIYYSEGPSTDPNFTINIDDKKWNVAAENLAINASGTIYVSGNINHFFKKRRKFKITSDGVKEIKQPFLYVGVKGKLLKPAKLYSDKSYKNIVASLHKGYEVEVLLAEDNANYLVRTQFGLVGWLHLKNEDNYAFHKPLIRGLGFLGD